ncbi:MAG: ABC transporter permease [Planctomycetales bacterium]|nr:ABC transporter permease [Planctomycetales bacterium]
MSPRWWRRLRRNPGALAGAAMVALVVLVALGAPGVAAAVGVGPSAQEAEARLAPPGGAHPLGCDHLGRDILVRVAYGARKSLAIGAAAVALALLLGVPVGLAAGYAGGALDAALMRLVDVLLAFPSLLLAIAIMAALGGDPHERNVVLAVALVNVPVFARQVRGSALLVRELDHVAASRALGAGPVRIVARAILPNVLAPVIVLATLGLATAILSAAGLSFLGLGVEPGVPEWGAMLTDAREFLTRASWAVLAPGAAITLTVLGVNLLGDGLRDALDPRWEKT